MSYDEYRGIDPETGKYKSFSERMKMAKADLAGRPDWAKQDFEKLINDLPDAVKNIPTVIEAIGKKFKMAKRVGLDRLKGGYEKEQKEREKRKKTFKKAAEGGSKVTTADKTRQKEV